MFKSLLPQRDPDADLVSAARAGDARAFDALVCRHEGALLRFLRARLCPGVDPYDVAQETFVAAWSKLGEFRGHCRFKTWLFGIALNLSANTVRRELKLQSRCASVEEENGKAGLAALPDGSDWSAVVERVELRRRLAELPDPGRQVLELYYYAGLNLREISQLLEVNQSTLKSWFYQAHERLRRIMAASGETHARETCAEARR